MLSVKEREAADTIFKVFGMTQLRIKPSLPRFAGKHSNHYEADKSDKCTVVDLRLGHFLYFLLPAPYSLLI